MTKTLIKRCTACKEYTMHDTCPYCNAPAHPNKPAKFSPEDHHGEYRRKLKLMDREE